MCPARCVSKSCFVSGEIGSLFEPTSFFFFLFFISFFYTPYCIAIGPVDSFTSSGANKSAILHFNLDDRQRVGANTSALKVNWLSC